MEMERLEIDNFPARGENDTFTNNAHDCLGPNEINVGCVVLDGCQQLNTMPLTLLSESKRLRQHVHIVSSLKGIKRESFMGVNGK